MPLTAFTPERATVHRRVRGSTPAQEQAWPAIASGEHVLISAPPVGQDAGAFLYAIDRLAQDTRDQPARRRISLVYVSPLKALSYDIDRNLRTPLRGIAADLQVQCVPATRRRRSASRCSARRRTS